MTTPTADAARCPECRSALPAGTLHGLCAACLWGAMDEASAETGTPSSALLRLPGLDLMQVIDRGGMGIVYRARDTDGARTVAVKMLLTRHEDDPEMVARFRQEAGAVSNMDHPGILPVYRVGEHEGLPFFSMKLADGGALTEHLTEYAGAWRKIAQLMAGLADAMHHAHSRGVLHRDVKPGNVLFDAAGRAYISDFGLVKMVDAPSTLTRSITLMGTPHYMAPEVAAQNVRSATIASDVWSLGAVLYELLAQRRPFEAPGIPALLRQIVEEPPAAMPSERRPPRDLTTIALKCLEKEPARRFASAAALRDDLTAWLDGRLITARPPSRMEIGRLWVRRNKALAAVSALAVISLATGAIALAAKNRSLRHSLAQEQYARATALRRNGDIRHRDEALALLSTAVRDGADPTAARDEAITLLATPGWREVRRIPAPYVTIPVLPDFSRLIHVKDGVLRLVPLEPSSAEEEIASPEPVTDVFGAAGDKLLVVTTRDDVRTRHLYDRTQRRWLREWPWRTDVSLCPQGRLMTVIADLSNEVAIEDLTGAEPLRTYTSLLPEPAAGVFSHDGKRLAFMSWNSGGAEVLDVRSGHRLAQFESPRRDYPATAAWRPDGVTLAVGPDVPDFHLWQIGAGKPWSRRCSGHLAELLHLAWHPSGTWLATTAQDGTLRLWNAANGREILNLHDVPRHVFFSNDGSQLLYDQMDAAELVLCAMSAPQVVRAVELPHSNPDLRRQRGPWGTALTPDGRAAVVGGDQTWLLDATTGDVLQDYPTGHVNHVLIPPDGSEVYIGQSNRLARVPLTRTFSGTWSSGALETIANEHGTARMAWSDATQTLAVSHSGGVSLRQPRTPSASMRLLETGREVNPLALSPNGRWVVTGCESGDANEFIFDTASPHHKPCAEIPQASQSYYQFSHDSRTLYTAGGPVFTARESGTWRLLWSHPAPTPDINFNRMVISGDGRLLAISTFPNGVQLRRARDGALLATLRHPDARPIAWLALDEKGTRLITTAAGHVVQIWDLTRLEHALSALGLAPPRF
jgi:eukaryotic-like serine/threonine-protein kinase